VRVVGINHDVRARKNRVVPISRYIQELDIIVGRVREPRRSGTPSGSFYVYNHRRPRRTSTHKQFFITVSVGLLDNGAVSIDCRRYSLTLIRMSAKGRGKREKHKDLDAKLLIEVHSHMLRPMMTTPFLLIE
jgi:hypothetical protein